MADPWQAAHLCQRLRARGVRVEEFSFSSASVGRLALTLYRLLRDGAIDLPDEPELLEELSRVRLVETAPGAYRIDHSSGEHDDRAISLALAALHLVDRPAGVDWTATYAKRCTSCDALNPQGAALCHSCGAPLEVEPELAANPWARAYGVDKPKPVLPGSAERRGWFCVTPATWQLEASRTALALVRLLADEPADDVVTDDLFGDTCAQALAHLCAALVRDVPEASDHLAAIGLRFARQLGVEP